MFCFFYFACESAVISLPFISIFSKKDKNAVRNYSVFSLNIDKICYTIYSAPSA